MTYHEFSQLALISCEDNTIAYYTGELCVGALRAHLCNFTGNARNHMTHKTHKTELTGVLCVMCLHSGAKLTAAIVLLMLR